MAQQMPQLQKKLLKKDNAILVKCQECGKKFKTMSMVPTCPKCGGSDIDLAEMKSLSSMVKEAEREEYYHIKKDGDTWNVVHSVHQSPQLGGQVLMNEQVPKKVCPNCGKTSLARPGIDDPYKCAYCGTKLNEQSEAELEFKKGKDGIYYRIGGAYRQFYGNEWHGPFKTKFDALRAFKSAFDVTK